MHTLIRPPTPTQRHACTSSLQWQKHTRTRTQVLNIAAQWFQQNWEQKDTRFGRYRVTQRLLLKWYWPHLYSAHWNTAAFSHITRKQWCSHSKNCDYINFRAVVCSSFQNILLSCVQIYFYADLSFKNRSWSLHKLLCTQAFSVIGPAAVVNGWSHTVKDWWFERSDGF